VCHTDAGGSRDWVYRANLFFDREQLSGAVPTPPRGLSAAARIPIQQYTFLPADVSVPVGTTVTWSNEDEAVHTVTAADISWDSGRLPIGAASSHTFAQTGTYEFACSVHAAMKGTITVS
jgi:plastocyanin